MSPLTTVLTQSTQHYAAAQRSRNYMTCSPKLRRRSARKSPELTPGRGRENRMAITGRVTFPAATAGALTVFLLRRFLGVLRMPALIHSNGSAFLADRGERQPPSPSINSRDTPQGSRREVYNGRRIPAVYSISEAAACSSEMPSGMAAFGKGTFRWLHSRKLHLMHSHF